MNITAIQMKNSLEPYLRFLREKERASLTVKKYQSDIQKFIDYIEGEGEREITKNDVIRYKASLTANFKISSVNSYLISLNKYLAWLGAPDLKAGMLQVQRRTSLDNVISRSDYERLLRYARKRGKEKMYYLMRTLAGTGIRIEELKYITVEAVTKNKGNVQVNNKGKIRDIVLTASLCRELRQYCKANGIAGGIIFHNRKGDNILDKAYIWRELKYIAGQARINKKKVHAHSFRHLFAKCFMEATGGDIVELADLLGHSSLETTRIYTRSSSREKRNKISGLGL